MGYDLSHNENILHTDEAYQIFLNPHAPIQATDGMAAGVAKKLAAMGLFRLSKHHIVTCRAGADLRSSEAPEDVCDHTIEVPAGPIPYSDADWVICERCGHSFFLSESRREVISFYQLRPEWSALLALFEARMTQQKLKWHKLAGGCYCILQGLTPMVFAVTDFVATGDLKGPSVFFKMDISCGQSPLFLAADFLCGRKTFAGILRPSDAPKPAKALPQLILTSEEATLSGHRLTSRYYRNQWQVLRFLVTHPDTIFSVSRLADALDALGRRILDPEAQVRRPLNKMRAQVEKIGFTKNFLFEHVGRGYRFNSEGVEILNFSGPAARG